jgi:1,2-diacylglycerol 3-alpha-glucosyltransferase
LVLLEAMAQGVPVVSIAEMGTRDVLREGSGVWITEEKVEHFSARVITMLGDEAARIQLGIAARDYAHGWSAVKLAQRMTAFYETVMTQQKTAQPPLNEQLAARV